MSEQIIYMDGIEICTEGFGNPNNSPILLIMGATASMICWEDEFCQRLANKGRYVIRYDNRDVGRSTTYPPGHPAYSLEDMADDGLRVLAAYGIKQAHLVGLSLGGVLAQIIALRHPDRVRTMTLMATSNFAPGLPPRTKKVKDFFSNTEALDWANKQAVVDFIVAKGEIIAGSRHPFDKQRTIRLALKEFRRANNLASMNNHALLAGGEDYLSRTKEIAVPTLVIHGTEDPVIPYEHGVHLAQVIPDASLITLEGTGHELHYDDWNTLINAIFNHTTWK